MLPWVLGVAAALAGEQGPRVHIEVERGPKGVVLLAREAQRAEVRGLRVVREGGVCTAPCDVEINVSQSPGFFVAGPGVLPSATFDLPSAPDVTVRVRAGRRPAFLAGWVLAGLGAPVLIGGATTMTLADDNRGLLQTGAVVAGVGVTTLLTGAILVATGRTRVRVVAE